MGELSSPCPWSRCHNPAPMDWSEDPGVHPLWLGPGIFVGEWHCLGEVRTWAAEEPKYLEMELPLAGVHLRSVQGRRWVVDPSRVLVHAAGQGYLVASPSPNPKASTILRVQAELLDELRLPAQTTTFPLDASMALTHARLRAQRDVLGAEELALQLVANLLGQAAGLEPSPLRPAGWRRLASRLEEALATYFQEPLTLATLAKLCGTSPYHAARVFRAVTGSTLHGRLNQLRLRSALYQIRSGDGRLSALALELGFSSHSHFTLAFRKEYGCAPTAWVAALS